MAIPRLEMYPAPGRPSDPPSWEDVVRLSHHFPAARHAVILAERGELTREQALIALTFALANAFSKLFQEAVDRKMGELPSYLVFPESLE